MKLFNSIIGTVLNKAGHWVDQAEDLFQPVKGGAQVFTSSKGEIQKEQKRSIVPEVLAPQVQTQLLKYGIVPGGRTPFVGKTREEGTKYLAQKGGDIMVPTLGTAKGVVKGLFGKGKERGFVTSVKESFPDMKRVAGQYIPRDTDRLAIKAMNFVKSNIDQAEVIAKTQTDDKAVAIASQLIKHYGDLAEKATDVATKTALNDRAAVIANAAARNLTELGRSVQAASILARLTPEGQIKFAAREIQRYNQAIEASRGGILGLKKKIPELTGAQADEIRTEMKAIENMAEGEEKAIRFAKLQDRISQLVPSTLFQKMVAVWKAGLLTGIKTSGLNILSNVFHTGLETLKDIPAVAVDSIASLLTKKRTVVLPGGGTRGVKEGVDKGFRYLRTGYDERNVGVKLDYRKVNFGKGPIAKGLQKYEEGVFRLIGAEDQPFYYGAKARSIYQQAKAVARNEKLKGPALQSRVDELVENPTDEMVRYAVLDAETAVFQNPTALGKIARGIQKLGGGVGEVILPFGRTPSAVATQVINYTPIGIVKTIIQNIGKGRFDQRLFSQGIGRGLTGTGVLYIGSELYKKDLISLDRPKTESERALWETEGRVANSIKIGDKWRTVQTFGPAGNGLLLGAHFQKGLDDKGSPTEAMFQALGGGAKSFSEQTFLSGVNQFVDALVDPKRSAEGFLGRLVASTIPTIVSDVARSADTAERRAETIGQRVQARVPLLRRGLEPQVKLFGEERSRQGNILEVMADPTRPSKITITPLTEEIRRLNESGNKISTTKLGNKAGFKGLTQEQNTELWKRSGEITEGKLNSLIRHPGYQKLDDEKKAKNVQNVIDKSKLIARVEAVLHITEGLKGEELKNKLGELKEGGLLTKEVFTAYLNLR